LILLSNTLYGTAQLGGSFGHGTLFAINTNGTRFTNLYGFLGSSQDGGVPWAGLVLSGNTLYGTVELGGGSGNGMVFKINTDGTGLTNVYSFKATASSTNSDGAFPVAGLILSSNTLYGTASGGGTGNSGTVFAVNTDGTSFTNLHSFVGRISGTNSDGANPYAGLVLSGNTLYGTTVYGGSSGDGTVFKVRTDGTGFAVLHTFDLSDGQRPISGLVLSGNTLYGTTAGGGSGGGGTVFAVNTDGSSFTVLYPLNGGSDGDSPYGGLLLSGNILYGTTQYGGTWQKGTIFSLSVVPQLTISRSRTNVIVTWPTNATGFTLQSTTNLAPPAPWTTNAAGPVIVNGLYAVTNPISGTRKFYRLSQ